MEVVRSRRCRVESSPDRTRVMSKQLLQEEAKTKKPMLSRRVQVVYYLTRNGQLEHPHFMEVIAPANQPLRLRDVMDRLTVLRGKGMPSLYSWSCKRSYRNGYVWNDLAENDVIYPSDGSEYVLKGSELVEGCSGKLQELQLSINRPSSGHMQEPPNGHHLRPKPKPKPRATRDVTNRTASFDDPELYAGEHPGEPEDEEEEDEQEEEEYDLEEEKTSFTSSTTPRSRCSRGVSTDELEFPDQEQQQQPQQMAANKSSTQPVRSDSAELTQFVSGELQEPRGRNVSKRHEDGDPVESGSCPLGRGSVLLQLIACGNIGVAKAKNAPSLKQREENLRRGVLCKNVVNKAVGEEEQEMIRIMSENPRFGNSQAEEKEYFSGSIVEAVSRERVTAEPVLRKSNSFNEARNKNAGTVKEEDNEEDEKEEKVAKGKCIPRKKNASWMISSSKQIKK